MRWGRCLYWPVTGKETTVVIGKEKTDETLIPVQIAYGETKLGKMARSAGGKWDPDVKLWYILYDKIKGTELEQHIILDAGNKKA